MVFVDRLLSLRTTPLFHPYYARNVGAPHWPVEPLVSVGPAPTDRIFRNSESERIR